MPETAKKTLNHADFRQPANPSRENPRTPQGGVIAGCIRRGRSGHLGHHFPVSHLQGGLFHKNRASELRKRGEQGAATAATTLYFT